MAEYEAYKDSGAVWIGKIPAAWTVTRLKNHLRRIDARNPGGVQVLSLYRELGIVPKDSRDDNHNVTSEDTSNYKYVQPGDFVVNKMKAWQGSVAVSDYEGIVSPAYYVYKFLDDRFHKRYFHYLIRSCYKEEFMSLSAGIRIGQWDLASQDLDNVPVLIPTMTEQVKIAEYLDRETERIDAVIAEAKASIEEYKVWKLATIHEAVTKGISPNTEMAESGVESFGSVPSHWKLFRFQNVCKLRNECNSGGRELLSVYLDRGVIRYSDSTGMQVHKPSDSLEKYQNVYVGDFVLNNQQAWRGSVGVSNYDGIISPAYLVYDLTDDCVADYMAYLVRDICMVQQYELSSRGVGTIQRNIYEPWLRKTFIILPPQDEQIAIAEYLNKYCPQIEALIIEKQELIADLETYKKSLIFEVVTGKRKVV